MKHEETSDFFLSAENLEWKIHYSDFLFDAVFHYKIIIQVESSKILKLYFMNHIIFEG